MIQRVQPERGQIWAERRPEYQKRRVVVLGEELDWGTRYVRTKTLVTTAGKTPIRPVLTRTRSDLWHRTFRPCTFPGGTVLIASDDALDETKR